MISATTGSTRSRSSDASLPRCGSAYPHFVDARGRCPPEDVGGPWGYADYLEAMSDPTHKRHAEFMSWLGRRDPNEIDRQAMEMALAQFSGLVEVLSAEPPAKPGRRKPRAA